MLTEFTTWLVSLITPFFTALFDLLGDAFVSLVDGLLSAVVGLIGLIPGCACLVGGLQGPWGQLHPGVMYVASQVHIPAALACIGSAFVFRLARKAVTLFQW